LDGGEPYARARRVNGRALAHFKARLREQRVVRRDEGFGDGRGLVPVQVGRNDRERALGRDDVLGLRAAGRDAEDALAHSQGAHLVARLDDFAREL
jgi:hypothetical protein